MTLGSFHDYMILCVGLHCESNNSLCHGVDQALIFIENFKIDCFIGEVSYFNTV